MVSKFIKFVSELIDYSKASQENEECVERKNALKAYYYITHIEPTQIGDLLLYCSSLSLMNRYVKQEDSILIDKNKYLFKSNGLTRLMDVLQNKNKINGFEMMFEIDKEKNNSTLLYTSIYGMHFCFHSVPKKFKEMIPKAYESQFEWDGIKKQKCANTLFQKIENNSLFVSKEGYKTKDIKKSAEEIAEKVLNDEMSLRQFKQICNFYIYKKNNNEVKSHEQNNTII